MSETVFISSVIGGFEAVRQAAREAHGRKARNTPC
jgi:hypothetical protein